MRRPYKLVAVAFLVLLAAGCATAIRAGSFVDRGTDFTRYRTYDWGPADALPSGDPRLDKNPLFKDHIEGEVEKQLAARGLTGPKSQKPDLLIHYHASTTRRLNIDSVDTNYGYCYQGCGTRVSEYEAGTLVLDFVDARTKKVVWRGWAEDSLEGMIADPDHMQKKIHEAVARMIAQFPARG